MTKIKVFMLAVAIAISFAAQANEVARLKNNDGGYIVFTANSCEQSGFYSAYGYGKTSNDVISGCFKYSEDAFWVIWSHDGKVKRYSADDVTWHPDFIEALKKKSKTY